MPMKIQNYSRHNVQRTVFASRETYTFSNFIPIDLKIGTLIDWTYTMYLVKKCIDHNNVTYVSMATKYPIIKHRAKWESPTPLWPFKLLMRAGKTRNSLNACSYCDEPPQICLRKLFVYRFVHCTHV